MAVVETSVWRYAPTKYPQAKYSQNKYIQCTRVLLFCCHCHKWKIKWNHNETFSLFVHPIYLNIFYYNASPNNNFSLFFLLEFWTQNKHNFTQWTANKQFPIFRNSHHKLYISRHVCVNWIERMRFFFSKYFSSYFQVFFSSSYIADYLSNVYLLELLIVDCCFIYC